MRSSILLASAAALALFPLSAHAQDHSGHHGHEAPQTPANPPVTAHDHAAMGHGTHASSAGNRLSNTSDWRFNQNCQITDDDGQPIMANCVRHALYADGSGTARQPGREGHHRHGNVLSQPGGWTVMAHGFLSSQYTDHSGPRGDDKSYVTSMAMLMGERDTNWGRVQLRAMTSLEPLMSNRGYPNLFATGETAGGEPLVDRQHPHDLFMELSARVDVDVSPDASLFAYGGPVAEPALGPSVFMHRGSAANNPEPPITHHWFDSTHITYGVATIGVATRQWQLETSLFTGREPDERRWNIEKPRMDSWSVRASWTPSHNWALQASYGELKEPEFSVHPGEDEQRFTSSIAFADNLDGGDLSAMLAFSAKQRDGGRTLTAWLAEANWDVDDSNSLFGRFENVRNDELFPDHDSPLHEVPFRVSKLQAGYARHVPLNGDESLRLTLGGSVATWFKPDALDGEYGKQPVGFTVFARMSLGH